MLKFMISISRLVFKIFIGYLISYPYCVPTVNVSKSAWIRSNMTSFQAFQQRTWSVQQIADGWYLQILPNQPLLWRAHFGCILYIYVILLGDSWLSQYLCISSGAGLKIFSPPTHIMRRIPKCPEIHQKAGGVTLVFYYSIFVKVVGLLIVMWWKRIFNGKMPLDTTV